MQLSPQTRVIGGATFTVAPFPATKSLKMFTRLSKLAAPALAGLAKAKKPGTSLMETGVEILGEALSAALDGLDEATMDTTAKELLTSTLIDGRPIQFDVDFAGGVGLSRLFGVLAFVVEVNYSDFLREVLTSMPEAPAPAAVQP